MRRIQLSFTSGARTLALLALMATLTAAMLGFFMLQNYRYQLEITAANPPPSLAEEDRQQQQSARSKLLAQGLPEVVRSVREEQIYLRSIDMPQRERSIDMLEAVQPPAPWGGRHAMLLQTERAALQASQAADDLLEFARNHLGNAPTTAQVAELPSLEPYQEFEIAANRAFAKSRKLGMARAGAEPRIASLLPWAPMLGSSGLSQLRGTEHIESAAKCAIDEIAGSQSDYVCQRALRSEQAVDAARAA